ncbi:MAG: hypothetical protein R3B70_11010 [Polyangiaceae bacterium]
MKKRGMWLVVAAVLLALSAWLMSRGDVEKPTVRPPKVEFPRHATPEEMLRGDKRRTLPPLPPRDGNEEGFRIRRDPVLVALPDDPKRSAMVFEVAALKETPIAQIWMDCLLSREDADRDRNSLERFKDRFGIDPMEDIERVAVSSERVVVLQGNFDEATFDPEIWSSRSYGENGTIYENRENGRVVAMWGDDMMIASGRTDEAEPVEDTIDRLESQDPEQKSILHDSEAYGDIYGVLSPDDLARMMPSDQEALAARVQEIVQKVGVHVDASEDVAITADVEGPGGQDLDDLSRAFGAALAAGRFKAKNDGDEKLAELLDYARVKQPRGGQFSLDVALPIELMKQLGPCRKDREPGRALPAPSASDGPAPR